jgi:hypothetical protein
MAWRKSRVAYTQDGRAIGVERNDQEAYGMTGRKAFEEWFSFRSPLTRDEKGAAWEAWQARAAQPSEPVAVVKRLFGGKIITTISDTFDLGEGALLYAAPPLRTQSEPVAWQHDSKECSLGAAGMHNIITTPVRDLWLKANALQVEHYTIPLYAAPPIRTLTDEEIVEIRDEHLPSQGDSFDCIAFALAIEAAIRSKE